MLLTGAECGITFTQFLLVMQDYYIALGAAKVHDIYLQMVDPDMSLEEWIEPECREEYVRTRKLMCGIAGAEGVRVATNRGVFTPPTSPVRTGEVGGA